MRAQPFRIAVDVVIFGLLLLLFLRQGGLEPLPMDVFRQRVREAQEQNAREDRTKGFIARLDRLQAEGAIGSLSAEQKRRVAETVLPTRDAIPEVLHRARTSAAGAPLSREERRRLIVEENARLRGEVLRTLQDFLEPADAQAIVRDNFGDPAALPTPHVVAPDAPR